MYSVSVMDSKGKDTSEILHFFPAIRVLQTLNEFWHNFWSTLFQGEILDLVFFIIGNRGTLISK